MDIKHRRVLLFMFILFLYTGCKDARENILNPGEDTGLSPDDDGMPHLSGSYDYSLIASHPRLLMTRAEEEILAVCDFSDWNPSHFLDVGEMALALAIGYDWLYNDLKPESRDKVRKALHSKAFAPSKLGQYNSFLVNRANWNQVCNAGLACAALAIYESDKKGAVEIIERSLTSIKLPLEDYGPDGNYSCCLNTHFMGRIRR